MKKTRKLWAFLLAMIMVLAMGMSAMAAGTGKITITPPAGTASDATNTYKIYKVFDADGDGTNISYKLVEGKTTAPAGFTVDAAGNVTLTRTTGNLKQLTAEEITAIADYVTEDDLVDTVSITGPDSKASKELPNGYYYITTSTGTAVTINSTNPDVEVQDKNVDPTLDKDIDNVNGSMSSKNTSGADNENGESATAQIGDTINYTAQIIVGKGSDSYVFKDKLSAGLTLVGTAPVIKVAAGEKLPASYYTLTKFENVEDDNVDDIIITFVNMNDITPGTNINISYSAILNENAVIGGTGNKNSATLEYDHETSVKTTPVDEPKVYTYKFQLVKDNADKELLTGAKFKLYDSAEGGNEIPVVKVEDGKYRVAKIGETGVEIEAGTPFIEGLAADKEYWLEETKAPEGYNKLTSRVKIKLKELTREDGSVTGGANILVGEEATEASTEAFIYQGKYNAGGVEVVNNKGAELPSTGGIGTTMFYVAGSALVLAAVVLLVTRKRMSVEK